MDEIWKPIPDTDYAVSNTGKVASMKKGWRVMRPSSNGAGYLHVNLSVGGALKMRYVHRLVAEAFLGSPPEPEYEVNHKNGVKPDNRDGNLEYMTPRENSRHSFDVLGNTGPRGERQWQAKLTEAKVREILTRRAAGESRRVIAADYHISIGHVGRIARGKSWGWLGDRP